MRTRRLGLFACLFATLLVGALSPRAEKVVAQDYSRALPSLNWVRLPGADSCICPGELARKVEARLGREVFFSSAAADVAVEGHIGPRKKSGWVAMLVISDKDGKILGSRKLETEEADCRALDEALALVIAVSIYPQSGLVSNAIALPPELLARLDMLFGDEATEPETDSDDAAIKEAEKESVDKRTKPQQDGKPQSTYVQRGRWKRTNPREIPPVEFNREAQGWSISAISGMGLGMVSDVSFGVGLVLGLQLPDFRPLDMRLNYWFSAEHEVSADLTELNRPPGRIAVSMLTTNVGLCPFDFGRPETNVRWCIGLGVGSMFASAVTENVLDGPMTLFGDAYSGINVNVIAIDPIALWFGATAEIPFSRPRARYRMLNAVGTVATDEQSFEAEWIMGKIEIGLSAYFF